MKLQGMKIIWEHIILVGKSNDNSGAMFHFTACTDTNFNWGNYFSIACID